MTRTRVIFLFLIILLYPALASADSFHHLGTALTFQSRDQAYRLRSAAKPWQLSEVGGLSGPSLKAQNKIWTFFDNRLHSTTDGLTYRLEASLPAVTEPLFIDRGDSILLVGRVNGALTMWRLSEQWIELGALPTNDKVDEAQIGVFGDTLMLAVANLGEVKSYRLVDNSWSVIDGADCNAALQYVRSPFFGAFCQDGRSWFVDPLGIWRELSAEPVEFLAASERLVLVREQATPSILHLYDGSHEQTITLMGSELPTRHYAVDNRILLAFSTLGLYELAWQRDPAELLLITVTYNSVVDVASPSIDTVFVSNGTSAYRSSEVGSWQTLSSLGDFNHAEQVETGWWVWQTNEAKTSGGLAQFLASNATGFVKVNPWASTTSPIQATLLGQLPAYVSVITNSGSGNVNLYRSTNYQTWSRVTLPTTPTLVRTILETRSLPAGSLVETNGVISVPVGVVSSESIYVQDDQGGIQVFLSSSKGNLTAPLHAFAVVNGEVSSSQTKRLILDAPDDLALGADSSPVPALPVSTGEVDQFQGRVVSLRDVVTELSTGYLTLDPELRIHFEYLAQNLKSIFQADDLVELVAIVDWNASTDQTEAWYFGRGYTILQRTAPAPKTAPPSGSKTSKKVSSTNTVKVRSEPSPPAIASKPGVKSTTPKLLVQGVQDSTETPTAMSSTEHLSTVVLVFLGLATGMLAIQGRRFQRLLK